jgi:hypothetical protein
MAMHMPVSEHVWNFGAASGQSDWEACGFRHVFVGRFVSPMPRLSLGYLVGSVLHSVGRLNIKGTSWHREQPETSLNHKYKDAPARQLHIQIASRPLQLSQLLFRVARQSVYVVE